MKILVVGCGSIGRRHAANAARLAEVAVYDADRTRSQVLAKSLDVEVFDDIEAAWSWMPDAAIISTPHSTHITLARQAIRHGVHVLIEKPLSDKIDGAADFIEEAAAAGCFAFVVCNMRYHAAVNHLRACIGTIGTPLFAIAHYGNYLPSMRPGADYRELYCASRRHGGGVILDAIHEIDYLSWLFGPAVVTSSVADRLSDLDIDVEDYATITLRHESGVRSLLHFDYLRRRKSRGCEIAGTRGTLIWDSEGKMPEHCCVRLLHEDGRTEVLVDDPRFDDSNCYMDMLRDFVTAVRGGGETRLLTARQALDELTIAINALSGSGMLNAPLTQAVM